MKKVTSILLLLLLCTTAHSKNDIQTEQRSDTIKIYFDYNSHAIDLDLKQNRESLLRFSDLIEKINGDTLSEISKIKINSYTSPEGGRTYNRQLSQRRSNALYDYLTERISVPVNLIEKEYSGTDWDEFQELVKESDMQYRDEVLDILQSVPEETWQRVNPQDRWLSLVDSRNKHLMDLKYGNPYHYMFANIYPKLRNGSIVTIYIKSTIEPIVEPVEEIAIVETPSPQPEPVPVPVQIVEQQSEPTIYKPLLAIKTNLLYDAITALNIEL